jgi:ribosome-binding factor A
MAMRHGTRAPGQRQLRVGEALRQALAELLARGELHDPDLSGVSITVSEVRLSPDLRQATAFVLPLGGAGTERVLAALNRAAAHLRPLLARAVPLKFTPALRFLAYESFAGAVAIDRLLHSPEVARDLAPPRDDNGEEDAGDGR